MDNGLTEEKTIVNPAGPMERLLQKRQDAMDSIVRRREEELKEYYLVGILH